jgi:hypothetical protein
MVVDRSDNYIKEQGREGFKMGEKKKNIIIIASLLGITAISGLVFAGNYFYNLAVNPNASKKRVFGPEDESVKVSTKEEKEKTRVAWLKDSSNYKDCYRSSSDGLKLHGYEIYNTVESNVWVITVHGYEKKENVSFTNFMKWI